MPINGVTVSISGTAVEIIEGSFEIDDAINSVSTCMFSIRDTTGSNHYKKSQPISITDSIRGLYYTGFIATVVEDNVRPQTLIISKVSGRDNHTIPERRTFQGPEYINQFAGPIAADLLNNLAADGITAQYASRQETTQAQFALGTLTGTTAQLNVGEGDLELSLAGAAQTITETGSTFLTGIPANMQVVNGALCQVPFNAIKIVATNSINNAGNTYTYVKIWTGSFVVAAGNYFNYTCSILASSPEIKIALDLVCSDGTAFRNVATEANAAFDIQDMSPHPGTDLVGLADGKRYVRGFNLGTALSGKTVVYATVSAEGDKTGTYTGYFWNAYFSLTNGGAASTTVYGGASSITTQQLQVYGYSSTVVSIAQIYDPFDTRTSASYSISGVGISASTLFSYTGTQTTKGGVASFNNGSPTDGSKIIILYSLDGGLSYTTCVNNAPLSDFPNGLSLAGKSIQFQQILLSSVISLEDTPILNQMTLQINPGYAGTKTDSITFVDNNTTWALGTFSNTTNNAGATLSLSSIIRNWDDGNSANQPLFGGTAAQIFTKNKTLLLGVDGAAAPGLDAKCQNVFASNTWQNFTAECDILIGTWNAGICYRTTNWGTGTGTYAFAVFVAPTAVYLSRGNNTASATNNTPTTVISTTVSLTAGNWHRLKIVTNGTTHTAFLDDTQMFSTTDVNFNATGYVGLVINNQNTVVTTHRQAQFDNFGIAPLLTGTWISQAVSLNALGTYYSSDFYYGNTSTDGTNCTVKAEYTINGGTLWTVIPGVNAPLPGLTLGQTLVGVSIQLRLTLTTTTATTQPGMNSVCLKVLGGFTASGTRVSTALALTPITALGSSVVAWNANVPALTTLVVATSINAGSTYTTQTSGSTIAGLTVQPSPTFDTFNTNTAANYTSTFATGGSVATWTYTTASSLITATSGSKGQFIENAPTGMTDVDMYADIDESDAGGIVWHYVDANNFYEIVVADFSSATNPNTVNLFKNVAGVRTQLQTNLAISFTRLTVHRVRVNQVGNTIKVYFDGTLLTNTTDSALASGKSGLRSDGGTSRYYQFNIQPLGQNVSLVSVLMRCTLTSTSPLQTPQVLNTALSAFGNTIQVGALIPQTKYNNNYFSANFDDLVKQCSASGVQWWWAIDKNKIFSMLPSTGLYAPWVASDNPGDFLDAGLTITDQSDLYRNRHIVKNVLQTIAINESRIGDGVSRSYVFGYQWASAPTITINGIAASVGIKNVDTGKTFYYAVGDNTITIDSTVTTFTNTFTLAFSGTGQYLTSAVANNAGEQTALATIDGTTGIVEVVEDGTGLTYASGLALAQSRVVQYAIRGKLINATTIHDGLAVGQMITVFLPEHGIADTQYLIRGIKTHLTSGAGSGGTFQTFWYDVELINGPDIGDFTKLYQRN
jgi:hypothetical protein